MGPGFRRESGSRSRQFLISVWVLAQPRIFIRPVSARYMHRKEVEYYEEEIARSEKR
jgi:uncharacterized DUF497 family protein